MAAVTQWLRARDLVAVRHDGGKVSIEKRPDPSAKREALLPPVAPGVVALWIAAQTLDALAPAKVGGETVRLTDLVEHIAWQRSPAVEWSGAFDVALDKALEGGELGYPWWLAFAEGTKTGRAPEGEAVEQLATYLQCPYPVGLWFKGEWLKLSTATCDLHFVPALGRVWWISILFDAGAATPELEGLSRVVLSGHHHLLAFWSTQGLQAELAGVFSCRYMYPAFGCQLISPHARAFAWGVRMWEDLSRSRTRI